MPIEAFDPERLHGPFAPGYLLPQCARVALALQYRTGPRAADDLLPAIDRRPLRGQHQIDAAPAIALRQIVGDALDRFASVARGPERNRAGPYRPPWIEPRIGADQQVMIAEAHVAIPTRDHVRNHRAQIVRLVETDSHDAIATLLRQVHEAGEDRRLEAPFALRSRMIGIGSAEARCHELFRRSSRGGPRLERMAIAQLHLRPLLRAVDEIDRAARFEAPMDERSIDRAELEQLHSERAQPRGRRLVGVYQR